MIPIPEGAKEKIWNSVIDFLVKEAGKYASAGIAAQIEGLRSDRAFAGDVQKAIEHAASRFAGEFADKELARALADDTRFYDLPSVQNAVRELLAHPFDPAPRVVIEQDFAMVLPERVRGKANGAAQFFLERLREELIGVKKLHDTLDLVLQLESVKTEKEMSATLARIEILLKPEALAFDELRAQYLAHVIGEWEKIRLIGFSHAGKTVDDPKLENVFVSTKLKYAVDKEARAREFSQVLGEVKQTLEKGQGITDEIRQKLTRADIKLENLIVAEGKPYLIDFSDETFSKKVDVNTALQIAQKAVVLGAPGAGKSTLLQWLALSFVRAGRGVEAQARAQLNCAPTASALPLRIVLRDFARERSKRGAGYAVEDYLHDHYRARGQNFPPQFFCHFIERGQCALLFDGMDEVGTAAQRIEMRDLIENLARAHPANRFIVTSRPKGYEAAPLDRREFGTFSILDFDDDAIRQFIENWYRAVEGKNEPEAKEGARLLSESLDANPNVKRLAVNPLMLTIIATIHRTERLPNQRVRLYDKCAESLLVKWDEVRGVGSAPIGEEEQRRRLEHIAYWMHSENIGDVERDELQRKLTRFLKPRYPDAADEASRFIDRLVERAGILVERSPDRFAFAHRTFQEYFAAMDIYNRYLDEEDPQIVQGAVMSHLHDPRWEEVSLLTMAKLKMKPATKLLQAVLSANSWGEDVLHRDLFFAARVLADDVLVERAVVERVVKELCDGLLDTHKYGHFHSDLTETLIQIVKSKHGDTATAVLRDLHMRFLSVRRTDWIDMLMIRKEPETRQLIFNLALTASDEWVRWAMAWPLTQLGEESQATRLLFDLTSIASNEEVRGVAIRSLMQSRGKAQVVEMLLDLVHAPSNQRVLANAAQALGHLGGKAQAIPLLLDLARKASSERVRWSAAQALGELGKKAQAGQLLLDLAGKASDEVRRDSIEALGQLGEKTQSVLDGLLDLARRDESAAVQDAAYGALRALTTDSTNTERINE